MSKKDKKQEFKINILFNENGEEFREVLEKIIFSRIQKDMEDKHLM